MQIAILDYGGQYVQNIRRAFREMALSAEIVPPDVSMKDLEGCSGIVLSGGPYSVYQDDAPDVDESILLGGKPILGLCYGHQLIAHRLGGEVAGGRTGEYGFAELTINKEIPLFQGLKEREICWMSHGDEVKTLPDGFVSAASTADCPNAAMANVEKSIYGLQFHPEVSHTPQGWKMLQNFAHLVCGLETGKWDVASYIGSTLARIKGQMGEDRAMMAVSGGVDSTVTAVLASRAIGDRLISVHVDHGFMRKNESQMVLGELRKLGLRPLLADARERFLDSLYGISDGDEKRKRIGELFIKIFEEEARRNSVRALIQGTIAPDAIESTRGIASEGEGSRHGGRIKRHHNVGGLPSHMEVRIVEPIRELFKYQVRMLGRALGIPDRLLERQPFPGPGLAVRIAGAVDREKVELLREITEMVENALSAYSPSQYLAYLVHAASRPFPDAEELVRGIVGRVEKVEIGLLGDVAVGVKGDERLLGRLLWIRLEKGGRLAWGSIPWLDILRLQSGLTGRFRDVSRVLALLAEGKGDLGVVIRAVDTRDFMTAIPSKIPFDVLEDLSHRIVRKPRVGLCFYEITTKPSSTIELE